jgi:Tol biopolymer transport system component
MHISFVRSVLAAVTLSLVGAPLLDDASAQYFGRNKVQYEGFDWQVLETEHFDVYHYEAEHEAAVQSGRMLERWYSRLSRILDHEFRGRQPVVLYANHPDFEQTNATFGQIGEGTGGLTEPLKRRIVLPLGASLKESDHVLGHELVHAFQFDLAGIGPEATAAPVGLRMPLWFIEGMAEYLSIGSKDAFTTQWMRGAIQDTALPDWGDLDNQRRYFPYRYGHALLAYVGGRWGDDAIGQLLKTATRAPSMRQAFTGVLGIPTDTLIADWHGSLKEQQGPVLEATQSPDVLGRALASEEASETEQNLGPSLSPDGDLMVFASERNLFSIELFVMNTETGEIVRKLTETARDPHFESLQWLSSTGAWSPDGERFAVAAVTKGDPVIAVFDPRTGAKLEEVRVPQVGEIFNPTWSPDGRRIAFSAQIAGFTDLYVLNVESGEVRRLTEDKYADLQPSWAPDGSGIALVTDRYGSDLDQLHVPDYRLALADPSTGEMEPIPVFEEGKHINPQWGPGGRDLYFVSDRNGVANVYRLDRRSGDVHQVTNLKTGVSGISGLSPAVSVARESGRAAVTVHGEGSFVFDIYMIEDEATLAGTPVTEVDALASLNPAQLPPEERSLNRVDELLADEDLGLPDPVTFRTHDYNPALSLDFIGRPNLAVGTNEFGTFVGGGGSAFFSDMLGNRNLSTLVQVNSSAGEVLNSTAAFGTYVNRSGRWDWGVQAGQIPLISRQRAGGFVGPNTIVIQDLFFWQINREATGLVEYPFHRSLRAEFSAGVRNTDFAARVREIFVTPNGQVLQENERALTELDTLSSVNTAQASAALVYDNTVFGATAPMLGQRYRLEVTPRVGDVSYYSALADYRKYFLPFRPFTLAFRGIHLGRYGGDADDFRLGTYFIGSPSLVRGYDVGFGDFSNCDLVTGVCPGFEELSGSRIAVFNAEARLPVLGGIGLIPAANVPPIDLLAFYDAGTAWNRDTEPEFLGGNRTVFDAAGVGARINLFGFAIFEVDYAYAFDRQDDQGQLGDWVWDFSVTPGF